jgi:hypothetical protein
MTTLDVWAQQHSVQRVDLVKIDVEGAEIHVLRGGLQFLGQTQPLVIMEIRDGEVRRRSFGYDVSDLIGLLCSIGYAEFCNLRAAGLARIERETDILLGDSDMLALCPAKTSHVRVVKNLASSW